MKKEAEEREEKREARREERTKRARGWQAEEGDQLYSGDFDFSHIAHFVVCFVTSRMFIIRRGTEARRAGYDVSFGSQHPRKLAPKIVCLRI